MIRSQLYSSSADIVNRHCHSAKSPEVMLAFYRRLFPYKPFFLWLNQEHGEYNYSPDVVRTIS